MDKVIVAYGDSHTKGVMQPTAGSKCAPYTDFLEKLVSKHLAGTSLSVSVVNRGFYGEDILPSSAGLYKHRLDAILNAGSHACIVAVGANNLGYLSVYGDDSNDQEIVKRLERIAQDLFSFYQDLENFGVEPISVTVPPLHVYPNAPLYRPNAGFNLGLRKQFNRVLLEHSGNNRILCADVFSGMAAADGQTKPEYRGSCPDDWLHFNEAGYARMAGVIFEQAVKPLLDRWSGRDRQLSFL